MIPLGFNLINLTINIEGITKQTKQDTVSPYFMKFDPEV